MGYFYFFCVVGWFYLLISPRPFSGLIRCFNNILLCSFGAPILQARGASLRGGSQGEKRSGGGVGVNIARLSPPPLEAARVDRIRESTALASSLDGPPKSSSRVAYSSASRSSDTSRCW